MFKDNWIHELAQLEKNSEPCVMVTVLEDRGSVPRDAGTKMLVTRDRLIATIGGGHLEHVATKMAREMLIAGERSLKVERFNLGARLGQCCGGMATLSFEPIGTAQKHLVVFGAGHVAKALLHIVSTLPFRVTWIDERDDVFPEELPRNVTKLVTDDPVGEVRDLPPNSYYLVMTHNHQLDFDLARAIIDRDDSVYFGMIGSLTKRKKFDMRLAQRGYTDAQIDTMICPIGVSMVNGKHPAEIAVSVAGELIAHYQGIPLEQKRPTAHSKSNQQSDSQLEEKIA
ncbi:xanthine dehydrogenase accessory factor XdhC [Vibrio orientalis CIP 102891 = ATCC 33934]|uniref:Xanthine dehydrogenase accessory factor XdhC n=1 Tax=Vibrio orientalis CIP 102891 = ATCC 33934 TaxID=675816 RepID=C9QH27_VIBOR|nr:xanthine dehydrogenase accessory protein XdhC [Vibrio orientalis]EEX93568.1 XdhC protein [Vibrio orientalis CIP 102891 = ATCC 33934]EGU46028.1 xanthine dehydrogenase accessory factor XdhC [Vibrio orientalis CIP 102891 = ATCC 33934]